MKPRRPEAPSRSSNAPRGTTSPRNAAQPGVQPPSTFAPRGAPPRPPAPITPSRRAAFDVLSLVAAGKGHSDDLLHASRVKALSAEDRNLTTALVMGVLRWQIALDAQIAPLLARPGQKLVEPVAIALRMGAFQLLHMDRIPAHAALSESVELCRYAGEPGAAGMVNAVLRRISTAPQAKAPIFETPARFAERLGHPRWLVERWAIEYGREAALAICGYDQQEPQPGGLFPIGEDSDLPQIDDGSRLIAELAAAAAPPAGKLHVWDCCAAPGGKAIVIAARLPDADILATDISKRRLEHFKTRLAEMPFAGRVRTAVADAAAADVPRGTLSGALLGEDGEFDLVLCDVPCSGTGTLAHNPEIRHGLTTAELARQAERQRAILGSALARLAPGGRLVYSTCSLEPEENERVVEAVVRSRTLRPVPIGRLVEEVLARGVLPASSADLLLSTAVRGEFLRTLPGVQPCDGFFAAVFERV